MVNLDLGILQTSILLTLPSRPLHSKTLDEKDFEWSSPSTMSPTLSKPNQSSLLTSSSRSTS
ncbi:hypothetical protein H0H92_008599, partial [Tricholoma furcatifolium]